MDFVKSPASYQPSHSSISSISSICRRREKILFNREIGGRSSTFANASKFEREIFESQTLNQRKSIYYQKDVFGHFGCVNAIEFSPRNEKFLASGGDDKRVLMWNASELISKGKKPIAEVMKGTHESNIFCLAFTSDVQRLLSSGNDHIIIVHDLETKESLNVYMLEEAVYSISVHPDTDQIFITSCEDGRVQLWDQRLPTSDPTIIAMHHASFQCAAFNPAEGRLIATANSRDGVQLWDVRKPKSCLMRYDVGETDSDLISRNHGSCMSVHWDDRGVRLLALRRRSTPVLFHVGDSSPIAVFDHPSYHNFCTMKSGCFAGLDDQYVVSGSENFDVFIWSTPPFDWSNRDNDKARKPVAVKGAAWELKGHRSIVNQVRYSKTHQTLASSGVEKIIKLWSLWPMVEARSFRRPRELYTHQEYLNMILEGAGLPDPQQDNEREATEEDQRMLAFFDSLLGREIAAQSSDYSDDGAFSVDLLSDSSDSDSGSPLIGRIRRVTQRLFPDLGVDEAYSNEIVESESSTDSSSVSISTSTDESSQRPSLVSPLDSDIDQLDNRSLRIEPTSDPEEERRFYWKRDSEEVDTIASSSIRSADLLLKSKTLQGQRKRSFSESGVASKVVSRQRGNGRVEDSLSGEEVRRRVSAAVAVSRRGRPAGGLARFARDSMEDEIDSIDGIENLHYARSRWDFSSSSSFDDSNEVELPGTLIPSAVGRQKRSLLDSGSDSDQDQSGPINQPSNRESFRKRRKIESNDEASSSNPGTSPKKRQYRRAKRQSNDSAGDSDSD